MARVVLVLLAGLLAATPLSAQRVADVRVAAAYPAARAPSAAVAANSGWDEMPPWARHAIVGGVIGALGGWLLSGLPCEGAAGSCQSVSSSIAVGAAIGAVGGVLWGWDRR